MSGEGTYYIAQEIAMAPGIADGWPDVIPAPHTSNGRLVKKEGNPSEILSENKKLRETLEWYEKKVSDCNRYGSEGDQARNDLAKDVGKRARTALKEGGIKG